MLEARESPLSADIPHVAAQKLTLRVLKERLLGAALALQLRTVVLGTGRGTR